MKSQELFKEFTDLLELRVASERKEKFLTLLSDYETTLKSAPASMFLDNNYCYEGGLLQFAINTYNFGLGLCKLYKSTDIALDFNLEEFTVAALFNSIGLCGVDEDSFFVEETSDWHRKNLNRGYKFNDAAKFLVASDKSLYLLQKYVTLSYNEYVAIKIQAGLYDDSASKYLQIPETKKVTLGSIIMASTDAARQMVSS